MDEHEINSDININRENSTRRRGGFFKKLAVCACMGLCFGLCAGAGVYVAGESAGLWDRLENGRAVPGESREREEIADIVREVIYGDERLLEMLARSGASAAEVVSTGSASAVVTTDISDVVEDVMPAMVSIVNHYVNRISYFGQVTEQEESASGSGIIVGQNESELLIATNYHVVEGTKRLVVLFIDGTETEAVVKGVDADMDLAVIAVPLDKLDYATRNAITIARLGDSDSLKLGEPVIAIGNALGYGQSVTGGWVSALNREIELNDGSTGVFIQTDAAINPGNSGGALLNMAGEVIGINSNKIGGTVIDGIGYAIPITAAQPILEELMNRETRIRAEEEEAGYLGIIPQTVTADAADAYGMPQGVFVSRVESGTPAEAAGMRKGDIIIRLDGTKLSTADDLRELLAYYRAGETVSVTVMRSANGEYEELTLQVTLGNRPGR